MNRVQIRVARTHVKGAVRTHRRRRDNERPGRVLPEFGRPGAIVAQRVEFSVPRADVDRAVRTDRRRRIHPVSGQKRPFQRGGGLGRPGLDRVDPLVPRTKIERAVRSQGRRREHEVTRGEGPADGPIRLGAEAGDADRRQGQGEQESGSHKRVKPHGMNALIGSRTRLSRKNAVSSRICRLVGVQPGSARPEVRPQGSRGSVRRNVVPVEVLPTSSNWPPAWRASWWLSARPIPPPPDLLLTKG